MPVGGGIIPPVASTVFPLDVAPLVACFIGAIVDVGEAFGGRLVLGSRS